MKNLLYCFATVLVILIALITISRLSTAQNKNEGNTLPLNYSAYAAPSYQSHVLEFGGDDLLIAPQSPLLNLGDNFTLETWIYFYRELRPYGVIMGKVVNPQDNDPYRHYVLHTVGQGRVEFAQTTGQPGTYRSITSPSPLPVEQWVHLAATLGSGAQRLFINGQEVASGSSLGTPAGSDVPFVIGGGVQGVGGVPCCNLQGAYTRQVRVWNRTLTQTEIANAMSTRLIGNENGLAAQWMLDDSTGQIATDSSVNQLHLQLGNSSANDSFDPLWARTTVADHAPFFASDPVTVPPNNGGSYSRLFDFDSDGDPDFLDFRYFFPSSGPTFAMRNNGLGVFSNETSTVLGTQNIPTFSPRHSAIADFNGDGRNDFVIADHGADVPPFAGGQTRILIQTSDGRLIDETNSRLPVKSAFTHHISAGDIEGDGDIDLYLSNICCGGGPELYINNGSGQFGANTSRLPTFVTTMQRLYTASAFMDVNGDNRPDLILGAHPNIASLRDTILLNNGSGSFVEAPVTVLPLRGGGEIWGTVAIEPADFDNDNKTDLLLSIVYGDYHAGRLQLLLNNGNGTFREGSAGIQPQPVQSTTPMIDDWIPWTFSTDFNNDGRKDFVTSSLTHRSHLYLNLGQGVFEDYSELLPSTLPFPIALPGDLDRDGDSDILVIAYGGLHQTLRNLKPFALFRTPFDYDGDGRADRTVRRPSNDLWYLLRTTAGFTAMTWGVAGDLLAPADYDGDGKTDIAVFRPSTGTWFVVNSGNGAFLTYNWGADGDLPVPA